MKIPATWREKIDDWEQRAEPFLGKYFFLFGPPLDRWAFLKAALVVMTVHRTLSFLLATGLMRLWGYPVNGASKELWDFAALFMSAVFLVPFAVVIYRRLFGMGISFRFMGWGIVIGLVFSGDFIGYDFWWGPYQIAFQLGIVLLLSFKTRREAWNDSPAPPDTPDA